MPTTLHLAEASGTALSLVYAYEWLERSQICSYSPQVDHAIFKFAPDRTDLIAFEQQVRARKAATLTSTRVGQINRAIQVALAWETGLEMPGDDFDSMLPLMFSCSCTFEHTLPHLL